MEQALASPDSLRKRQAVLQKRLQTIVGELPEKSPLNARTTGTLKGDGFRVEKVVFQSRPQHYVTANLYIPEDRERQGDRRTGTPTRLIDDAEGGRRARVPVLRNDGPFPGVLIACGHSGLGKAYSYYQKAAMLIARNGMMALVYDCIGQG